MQQTIQMPVLLNPMQAAQDLGCSPQKLERDRWCERQIPYVKLGRHVRYRAADLEKYVNENLVNGEK